MTVGSPQLVSAEQSAANPVPFRLVNVFTPGNAPVPGQGARLVLVETDAGDGTITPARFSRVKRLATANVETLSRQATSTSTKKWNRPRVLVDTGHAFAWMAPAAEKNGSGVASAHGLKGMLYLSVCRRILVLSPRTDRASAAQARWISHEVRWLGKAVRKANQSC